MRRLTNKSQSACQPGHLTIFRDSIAIVIGECEHDTNVYTILLPFCDDDYNMTESIGNGWERVDE